LKKESAKKGEIFRSRGSLRLVEDLSTVSLHEEFEITKLINEYDPEKWTRVADTIEEEVFPIIAWVLNCVHGINWGEREWKIVIGHWLRRSIRIYVSRRNELGTVIANKDIEAEYYIPGCLCRQDTLESMWSYSDVSWNKSYYALLNGQVNRNKNKGLNRDKSWVNGGKNFNQTRKEIFKNRVKLLTLNLSMYLGQFNRYVITEPLVNKAGWVQLWIKLKTICCNKFYGTAGKGHEYNEEIRNTCRVLARERSLIETDKKDIQEFMEIIWESMPTSLLEGFAEIYTFSRNILGSKTPKNILTANAFDCNEYFKMWTAVKVNSGVQYTVVQHGSNYGTSNIDLLTIEEETSDIFLNWGWRSDLKHRRSFISVELPKREIRNLRKDVLMVMIHAPLGVDAFDDISFHIRERLFQGEVYTAITEHLRQETTIRLHPSFNMVPMKDDIWWKRNYPGVSIDEGRTNFGNVVDDYKLILFTYNSCGFLQCLASGRPTMIVMKGLYSFLRSGVKEDYKRLEDAGLVHTTVNTMRECLEAYETIEDWWENKKVKAAREHFCSKYARVGSYIGEILNVLFD